MTTLSEIKAEYLSKALSKPVAKYGVKMGNGRITSLSDAQGGFFSLFPLAFRKFP